jgi:hypothetical protein
MAQQFYAFFHLSMTADEVGAAWATNAPMLVTQKGAGFANIEGMNC